MRPVPAVTGMSLRSAAPASRPRRRRLLLVLLALIVVAFVAVTLPLFAWPAQGMPARVDAIVMLDTTCWAALFGLIDECPVLHAALAATRGSGTHVVDPSAFEFISENRQIGLVREFIQSLPERLIS